MKRRKFDTEEHKSPVYERPVQDKRVIDLRKKIDYNNTNIYIPWPSEPLHLTLCAGDGVQLYNGELLTDIEYFTRGIEGYDRNNKPTNIFCCAPDYNTGGLQKNIEYLTNHKDLNILLVLCDTTDNVQLGRFSSLFANKLTVIQEDLACYGNALSYNILNRVLVPGGQYKLDDAQKIHAYPECDNRFNCVKKSNKLVITKNITGSGTKRRRANRRKSRRKLK
jgi:hypothetical protein